MINYWNNNHYCENQIVEKLVSISNYIKVLMSLTIKLIKWKVWEEWSMAIIFFFSLTHCGLVTKYGDRDLDQHWLTLWLVAWRNEAIIWTNLDLLVKFCENFLRATLQNY